MVTKRRFMTGAVSCSCSMPGVWRAVAHCEGCAVVYHAPASCAHITGDMDRNHHFRTMGRGEYRNFEYRAPLITTGMGKKESIFGGVDTLRRCLAFVLADYAPQYIVVADSCLSGVIGDDTGSICAEMEEASGIPILHIDCHGFLDGGYYGGFIATAKALIDRFIRPLPKDDSQVTILGEKDGPQSSAIQDFCSLLAVFGLKTQAGFPGYSSLTEMAQIGRSKYTMVIGGTPKSFGYLGELAQYLEEKVGSRYFEADYPVGWEATKTWIQRLADFLEQPEKAAPAITALWDTFTQELAMYKPWLEKTPLTICLGKVGQEFNLSWVLEWCSLGAMPVSRVVLLDAYSDAEVARYEAILRAWDPTIRLEREAETLTIPNEDVVITTSELNEQSMRQLILPCLPPIGPRGFLLMYRKLVALEKRTPGKGVVFYGW